MNQLDRLEALAQRLIEGTFSRVFPDKNNNSSTLSTPVGNNLSPAAEEYPETKEVLRLNMDLVEAARWQVVLPERTVALGQPVINIGRALDNDLVLDDSTVSRYHVQLRWRGERYHLYPPSPPETVALPASTLTQSLPRSRPHSRLNGRPLSAQPQPLNDGDVLELGRSRLTVKVD